MFFRTPFPASRRSTFAAVLVLLSSSIAPSGSGSSPPRIEEVGPGVISTAAIEDGIAELSDGSIIISRRPGIWGETPSHPSSLLIYRPAPDGGWQQPERLFPGLSDASDPALSPDGQRLVFTSAHRADANESNQDLWMASWDGTTFVDPVRLGPEVNSTADEMGASFGPDGSIWFSSTRPGGAGSGDLWRALPSGRGFAEARPVGPPVSSPHGEWNVMVARDERYIVFEGSGRATNLSAPGDLYISWREEDGWGEPVNLRQINTTGSDLAASMSRDGKWLYFVSTRSGGSGEADIYRVDATLLLRAEQEPKTTALRRVRLLDPGNHLDLDDGTIVCSGDRIVATGRSEELHSVVADQEIAGRGLTVVPGLFDAHVHMSSTRMKGHADAWPVAGILSVIDMGGTRPSGLEPNRLRVYWSGPILTAPGGYPDLSMTASSFGLPIDSSDGAAETVRLLVARDHPALIKIAVERGFESDLRDDGWPVLSGETISAISKAAADAGIRVAAHLTQSGELEHAIDHGVSVVAHTPVSPIPSDLLKKMVDNDVVLVTTLSVWDTSEYLETAIANVAAFHAAGGQIALGTDAPRFQSAGFPHREVELLRRSGLDDEEILLAMTHGASAILGRTPFPTGLVRGARCDFILVHGDPSADLEVLARPAAIMTGGTFAEMLD